MSMLKELKPKFTIRQAAQGASYFDILEGQGLAKGLWNMEKGKS